MVPPESLSQYLSNEYQCYGVQGFRGSGVQKSRKKLPIFFASEFGDKSRPPSLKG
jgi:hypothetical protein